MVDAPPAKRPRNEVGQCPESVVGSNGFLAKSIHESGNLDPRSVDFAAWMDSHDELSTFREEFHIPETPAGAKHRKPGSACIYLCGNSLGLQPKNTQSYVVEELEKWRRWGVEGHFPHTNTVRPWVTADEDCRNDMAEIVGAKPTEVVIMNSLTVNLHVLMCAFYRPTSARHKIIMEGKAFPSDKFAVASQIRHHGFHPDTSIIEVTPRKGENTLRTEDVEAAIAAHGDEVSLVMFGGVQYYTGQLFQMERITQAAKTKGCAVGFDLAHAVGNVPLKLHDWGCDFACWCTYKYMNSGPGNIAGAFVHERHSFSELPGRLEGWWGHRMSDRFEMEHQFVATPGAQAFMMSNPPVLCVAALRASTELFARAKMSRLRAKSVRLTAYLEVLLAAELGPEHVEIISPDQADERGCQLSLVFRTDLQRVHDSITSEGVICDLRKPSVMRIAPVPLYNTYQDVHEFVGLLKMALRDSMGNGS